MLLLIFTVYFNFVNLCYRRQHDCPSFPEIRLVMPEVYE